jgi:hypothetical protein
LLRKAERGFDLLRAYWEGTHHQRSVGTLIIIAFLAALVAIEMRREGWLPPALAAQVPANHFYAVDLAFTLLLLVEVVTLVFSLAESVARSVGMQFEIFSLILLRQTFKEFTTFTEPVTWDQVSASLVHMLSDASGALLIFVVLGVYYRLQHHQPITTADHRGSFVGAKKVVALALLATFVGIGINDAWRLLTTGRGYPFFEAFYTVLIFSDLLLVLLSLRYSSTYHVVFRNSGFAAATVFMRLALAAPAVYNAALGLLAVAFACVLTYAYNRFTVVSPALADVAHAPPETTTGGR